MSERGWPSGAPERRTAGAETGAAATAAAAGSCRGNRTRLAAERNLDERGGAGNVRSPRRHSIITAQDLTFVFAKGGRHRGHGCIICLLWKPGILSSRRYCCQGERGEIDERRLRGFSHSRGQVSAIRGPCVLYDQLLAVGAPPLSSSSSFLSSSGSTRSRVSASVVALGYGRAYLAKRNYFQLFRSSLSNAPRDRRRWDAVAVG